mgnify:FL=1
MKVSRFVAISRAWLRKTARNSRDMEVGLSGPTLRLNFKQDEPFETRVGSKQTDNRPFYQTDAAALLAWYHGYASTPEFMDNVLYADVIPIRSAGLYALTSDAIATGDIELTIEPSNYRIPEKFKAHAAAAVELFKTMKKLRFIECRQEWENNTSLRVISIEPTGRLKCQKARYFDQVGTNLTIDWASGAFANGWRTIRIDAEHPIDGKLPALRDSNLANTLGVAVMFYDRQLRPIVRTRIDTLASIPHRGLHCTASGVHEVAPNQAPGKFDYALLESGMIKEIEHEIGLLRDEYALYPVAFARELARGGKPQLFFAALAKVDEARIRSAMAAADETYEYLAADDIPAIQALRENEFSSDLFTYEGWACLRFAERFIEANRDAIRVI